MENEKRKVGDYTVLCAVNIGSREIILAENEQDIRNILKRIRKESAIPITRTKLLRQKRLH